MDFVRGVGRAIYSVGEFYSAMNPSTLTGAVDVIVIQDVTTGTFSCSPFHVRFGKLQLFRPQDKIVDIFINDVQVVGVDMKVGEAGEAFFVVEALVSPQDDGHEMKVSMCECWMFIAAAVFGALGFHS